PVYAAQSGFDGQSRGYLVIALNLGCILLMSPVGKLSDRFDRRKVMMLAAAASALTAAATVSLSGHFLPFLILIGLLGGCALPLGSLASAYINDWLAGDEIISAASTIVLVGGCGAVLGPLVAGTLMDWLSLNAFFHLVIAVMTAFTLFALYRMTRRSRSSLGEATHAVPMGALNPVSITQAYDQRQLADLPDDAEPQ
ncbi:MAG: MFS transporter, partial [Cardiobacteriaceae bacterium]|nr:MFS transporter [Cardiobacteriaceae bacterium]